MSRSTRLSSPTPLYSRHAIERHAGQAQAVTDAYQALGDSDKDLLRAFLDSL